MTPAQINGVLKEEGGKQTDQAHPGAPRLHSLPAPPWSAALLSRITADLWTHLQRFDAGCLVCWDVLRVLDWGVSFIVSREFIFERLERSSGVVGSSGLTEPSPSHKLRNT